MQEVEILPDYPIHLLSFPGYELEVEQNVVKSRVAIYISSKVEYTRRKDLEGTDNNMIIIDIKGKKPVRIINIYRSFNPQNGISQRTKFQLQLNLISNAINGKVILLGDFNLDDSKRYSIDYNLKNMFLDLENAISKFSLHQMVNFVTWSRYVNQTLKTSILDHIYTNDSTIVDNLNSFQPNFGDHLMVFFDLSVQVNKPTETLKRDWRHYSKNLLCVELSKIEWCCDIDSVQEMWNTFENNVINVIDRIAPLTVFINNVVKASTSPPPIIKNALNKRQRFLKLFKKNHLQILNLK